MRHESATAFFSLACPAPSSKEGSGPEEVGHDC